MAIHLHLREPWGPRRLRLAAIALLAVPAGVLLLFAFGEMIGGDPTGVQHIPEAAVLILLIAVAWRHARVTGIILLASGTLLFAVWLVWAVYLREPQANESPLLMLVLAAIVLFLPPLVAGWLLLRASAPHTVAGRDHPG